ncbi:hypothetical protein DUI87_25037 [Hirundo rustica rustica]|uniref:Uncharacterized protein n=1 Tax=Hirundo rustica rustica TaxID=333673 RepID=A0A3M0JD89_HIRRU|nr:hypothetical protein DUI87_25037 [Hirundo rustica rustica]
MSKCETVEFWKDELDHIRKRGVRVCEGNDSADTKVSVEGGAGSAPGAGAEIPLQPLVQPMVRQLCPAAMEVSGGAEIRLEQVEAQRKPGNPWEQTPDRDLQTCGERSPC